MAYIVFLFRKAFLCNWIVKGLTVCFILSVPEAGAQQLTTFGFQFKPIFPVSFLGTGPQSDVQNNVRYDLSLSNGFNFGMVIRKGFTDLLALETGINYVKRKYDLDLSDSLITDGSSFRVIGYEIPVSLLVYIRLGEKFFMNASMGVSADMYASNTMSKSTYHRTLTARRHTFQPAVLANLGWEYRTEKSGYIYLGASLHRPFSYELVTQIHYEGNGKYEDLYQPLSGSYLTVDVRYFFHEDPERKKKKKS